MHESHDHGDRRRVAASWERDRTTLGYVADDTRVFVVRPAPEGWRALTVSTVLDAVGASPDPVYRELEPQLRETLTVGPTMEDVV